MLIDAPRPSTDRCEIAASIGRGLMVGLVALLVIAPLPTQTARRPVTTMASSAAPAGAPALPRQLLRVADSGNEPISADARHLADWVADSGDNAGADFFIVDKKGATLLAFNAAARLVAATPVLIGAARGDDSVPGIGTRPIAQVRPHERTTPAGRFVAERGRNSGGEDVIWVDYDAAVSMHRVRATQPKERRLERLASVSVDDNRISYGCINVPAFFYEAYVRPVFATRRAIVYVLPEVKTLQQVFGSYEVAARGAPVVVLGL
jgi:hypothetical protein